MKFRLARKVLRRKRRVRFATAMAASRRLNQRARRWGKRNLRLGGQRVLNKRPTFTLQDLLTNLPILTLSVTYSSGVSVARCGLEDYPG